MARDRVNTEDINPLGPVDWVLHHIGLPGPTDVIPSPRELLDSVGVPSPDAVAENLKANLLAVISARRREPVVNRPPGGG